MPSGGGSDYMLKVGADFSGVIQELSKVESFAKSTEGGLLAPPQSGVKPFATVTEGTRYSGRTVAVSEVAREQAERIAIQMQDGILRSVKANELSWSRAREFKPDDAKLKEIGTAYASKLRLAGEEMQSFVASFTSQVQAMFGPKSVWASKVIGTSSGGVRKNLDPYAIEAFQGSAKAFERERKAYLTSAEKRTSPAADERIGQQKDRVGRALIAALEEEVKASYGNLSTAKRFDIVRRRAILALQGEDFKGYRASVSKALTEASRGLDDTLDITSADIGPSRVSKMSKKNLDLEVQANAERAIADMNKGLIAVDELGLYLQSMARPKSNWGRQQYEQASKVQMASLTEIPRLENEGRDPSDVFDAEEAAALKLQRAQQEAAALMELVIYHLTDYVEALSQRVFLESAINTEVQKQIAISPLITETLAEEARQKMLVANAVASNKLADPLYLTASSDQGLLKRQQEAVSKLAGLRSSTEPDIASRAASLEQRSLAISGDILKSGEITADIRNRINSLLNDSMGLIQADNAIQRQIAASDTFAKEAAIRNANTAAERASLGAVGKASYAMSTPVVGDVAQELHKSGGRRELGLDPTLEIEAYRIYIEQLKADLKSSAATRTGIKKIDDELYIAKQSELKVAETSLASIKAAAKRQEAAFASRGGDRSLRPDIAAATAANLSMKAARRAQADLDAISASPAISRGSVAGITSLADLERDQYLTLLEKRKLQESIGDGTIRSSAETEALEERLRAATQRLVELKEHSGTLAQRAISEDVVSQRAVANMQARLQATNVPFDVGVANSKLLAASRGIGKIGFGEDGERLDAERKLLMQKLVGATSVDKDTQDRITALNIEIEYILEKRKNLERINLANYGTMPVDKRLASRGIELERLAVTSPAHAEAQRRIEMSDRSPFYSEEFGQYSRMSQEALSVEGKILAAQLKRLQYLQDIASDDATREAIGKQILAVESQQSALSTTKAALNRGSFVDTNALQAYRQTALNRIAAGAVTPASGAELSAVEEKAVMQQIVAVLTQQLNDETVIASLTDAQIKAKNEMVMAAHAAAEAATKAARTEKENALIADQQRMLGKTPYQKIAAERGAKPTPTSPDLPLSSLVRESGVLEAQLSSLVQQQKKAAVGSQQRADIDTSIALIKQGIRETESNISAAAKRELEARRAIEAMTEAEYAAAAEKANAAIASGQIPVGLEAAAQAQLMAVIEQEINARVTELQNIRESVGNTEQINILEARHRALLNMSNEILEKNVAASGGGGDAYARLRHSGGAGGFFAGGLMSTIRYGLPSMALFGAFSGFKNLIKESEELQYNMAILEDQFKAVFSDADFGPVRGQITALARETGLQADEIARLRIQITGAFSAQSIKGVGGPTLVEEQTKAAAKMAQTLKIPLAEINDGLQAASLNFHVLYEDIGDVATALEQRSGVLAKEIVSFVGDTAPVFKEAGFSMQETAAIAAVSAQRSGRSGTAIAEAFGRVIPALTENADKLRELAAMEPSLATPKFLDALRTSNVKDIFDEVGRAYNNMSVEGQQALVQALGGRREAPMILPALTNRALIEEYTRSADDATGTLEERFKRIQGTLTNAMQRLGEYVKTLGVDLMDAGLEDVFSGAIDLAKVFVSTLSPILKAATAINDMFGKWPVRILAAAAAFKAFNALMMVGEQNMLGVLTNRVLYGRAMAGVERAVVGEVGKKLAAKEVAAITTARAGLAAPELGAGVAMSGGLTGAAAKAAAARQAYQASRLAGKGIFSSANAGLGAAGASLAGVSTVAGIGAGAALAMWVKGERDKNKAALEELNKTVDRDVSAVDVTDEASVSRMLESLRSQGEKLRRAYNQRNTFLKVWDEIVGSSGDWKVYESKAAALDVSDDTRNLRDVLVANAGVREKFMKKSFEEIGVMREDLINRRSFKDRIFGLNAEQEVILGGSTDSAKSYNVTASQKAALNDISKKLDLGISKDKMGYTRMDLDPTFYESVIKDDGGKSVLDLASGKIEGASKQAVEQAISWVEFANSHGVESKEIKELLGEMDKLPPADQAKADLQDLQKMLDLGLITADQYAAQAASRLNTLNALASKGTQEETAKALISTAEQTQAAYKAISDHITAQQTSMVDIYTTLGYSENATQNMAALYAVANLRDPKFRDPAARLEAAKTIIEVQRRTDMELAVKANDQARINELLTEGAEMSPEVKKVMFRNLFTQSGGEQSFINALNEGLQYAPKVPSKDYVSGDASKLLDDWLFEYQQFGKLSDKSFGDIKAILNGMMSARGGLDADALAQIDDGTKWIIQMLAYSGMSRDEILSALKPGSRPSTRGKFKDLIDRAFGGDNEFKKIQEQLKNMKILGGVDEFMKVIEADAELKKSLLKGSSVGAALIEANVAQQRLDLLRQARASETDIMKAQAEVNNANQKVSEAKLAQRSSLRDLAKTRAEINGDAVAAAEIAVQDAQDARNEARGDEIPAAQARLEQAQEEQRKARIAVQDAWFSLQSTMLTDPVEQAQAALTQAQQHLADARGDQAKLEAYGRVVESQRALNDAMASVRQSYYTLRQAELQAMGDDVGAAEVAAQAARDQLMEAVKNKRGDTEIRNLRAQVVTADKAAKDALFDEKMYDYKWMMDMGQITKGQYADYLEGLKSTLIPGTRQFKELELTIKQLKDDIGSDLQHNLPTSLALPTLYEVRRLNQMQGSSMSAAMGGGIGYQDNRTQDIVVYVSNGMGAEEVVGVLQDALDGSRSGSGPRRY